MGYVEETGIAQYFRDARIAPIYAGTNGIQALDLVFRKIPLDGGKAIGRMFDEMESTVFEIEKYERFIDLSKILKFHINELKNVTESLTDSLINGDLVDLSGSATPFLKMFGQVLGGHYMGKALIKAHTKFEESNNEFYEDKITLSKFYIEQLLPLASGYIDAIKSGDEDLFKIKSNSF